MVSLSGMGMFLKKIRVWTKFAKVGAKVPLHGPCCVSGSNCIGRGADAGGGTDGGGRLVVALVVVLVVVVVIALVVIVVNFVVRWWWWLC